MLTKDSYRSQIEKISEIVCKYNLNDMFDNDIKKLLEEINRYSTKVVLVGKFSAGKSALLNTLMGRYILSEKQLAETAIATELVFDSNEYIEFIDNDNDVHRCEINGVPEKDIDNYKYCVYHLDSSYLNEHKEITLVDMPGFDSSVERHNKAILRYIDEASAYLLLIDIEDGTIQQSAIDFMNEVKRYNSNLVIILTKCDKKIEEDVLSIKSEVAKMAADIFCEDVPVISVSRFDDNLIEVVDSVLAQIDGNDIFRQKFVPKINNIVNRLDLSLTTLKENYVYDTSELDEKIEENLKEIEAYKRHIEKEKKNVHYKLYNVDLPNIMNDIELALNSHVNEIVEAALKGPEIFKQKITEIVRPILLETLNDRVSDSMGELFTNIDIDSTDGTFTIDPDKMKDFAERLKRFIDVQSNNPAVVNADKKDDKDNKSGNVGNVRKVLTVLAVLTDYIAPAIEVIIIFAPEICDMLNAYLRKLQKEQIKDQIIYEVIPAIRMKMEPIVKDTISKIEKDMLDRFDVMVEDYKNVKNGVLEKLKIQSETDKESMNKKIMDIDLDLSILKSF